MQYCNTFIMVMQIKVLLLSLPSAASLLKLPFVWGGEEGEWQSIFQKVALFYEGTKKITDSYEPH